MATPPDPDQIQFEGLPERVEPGEAGLGPPFEEPRNLAPDMPTHSTLGIEGRIEAYGAIAQGLSERDNRFGFRRWLIPLSGVLAALTLLFVLAAAVFR